MSQTQSRPGLDILEVLAAWKSILTGSAPMMSIEVTRECPLNCPGCYAYGEMHLGGSVNLRSLSDYRGDELVDGIVHLVQQHRPLHVSLVGGEPLVRHRELSRVLPILSNMKVHTMVVTSAVIPIPLEWMSIPRVRVTVSADAGVFGRSWWLLLVGTRPRGIWSLLWTATRDVDQLYSFLD